ncbi:hypothetical protein BBJ28_00024337, partial [Nothophytophthora sp. Chile5]
DRSLLDLLTSDRGDAVLKEFFTQWRRLQTSQAAESGDLLPPDASTDGTALWEVLQTFFANLPLVLPDRDTSDTGSNAKAFFRYLDALKSLQELLLALLFKPQSPSNEPTQDTSDDDEPSPGLASSLGLGFGLDFRGTTRKAPQPPRSSTPVERVGERVPLFLYCQQLERELETLRRRMPSRRPHGSGGGADDTLGDVGLLQDQTMLLLLDFWRLPQDERLAFFCQVASQANEQDAAAILRVFLGNSSTQTFHLVWDALQHSPQLHAALGAVIQHHQHPGVAGPATGAERRKEIEEIHTTELGTGRRASRRISIKRRGRRPTRFVDLNGITEAFDDKGGEQSRSDADDEQEEASQGAYKGGHPRDSPRFRKLVIREHGRLSLSDTNDQESPSESTHSGRKRSLQRSDRNRRMLKSPDSGSGSRQRSGTILERLHDDLTEIIKLEDGPDVPVMDAVWELLEALDSHRVGGTKSGYHRRPVALNTAMPVLTLQPQQPQLPETSEARATLRTPLSNEQQFLMKLDQLQSMLVALGDFRVHSMSTETITGAYRRMPQLTKLFAVLSDVSLSAAGVDPTDTDVGKSSHRRGKPPHQASFKRPSSPKERQDLASLPSGELRMDAMAGVREDVEAMGLLLVQFSKFVRSLAHLVEAEDVVQGEGSARDAILAVMDLADKLESAGTLAEAPSTGPRGGGKRRLTLAADRELPIILAVQSLARSNQFDDISRLIATRVRARTAPLDGEDEEDSDEEAGDAEALDGDEAVLKMVLNAKSLRRASAKAAQIQATQDQLQLQIQTGGAPAEGDVAAATPTRQPNRDIPLNIKNAAAQRGLKLFSIDILLRVVNQLYRDNFEGLVASLQYGNRRMEFSEFIYDWHIRKYGLKALAQRHLLKLIQSLRKHEKKVFQCQLCLRFMGIHSALGFHEHKFVLVREVLAHSVLAETSSSPPSLLLQGLLNRWSLGTFSGSSKHRIELTKRQFKVRVTHAVATVLEALRERFGVYARGLDTLAERIRAKARPRDEEFVRENDLLALCVEEFATQRTLLDKVLEAVYLAGDLNGDGSLEFDEFAAVVTHLSPTIDDGFLQKVFAAAHDFTKPRRISFARFLDVILVERVLSPTPPSAAASGDKARAKAAANPNASSTSGSGTSAAGGGGARTAMANPQDEQEETYQFDLLRETWTHDRDSVSLVLQESITHAPTAKSLAFRVAFLDQLLERRVDAKTAWLCHRQIMREIARYQHLDAEQIAGLRQKEQQFKKAVRAIRHVQRLSALSSQSTVGSRSGEEELEASAAEEETPDWASQPNYTAAVEQKLGLRLDLERHLSEVADASEASIDGGEAGADDQLEAMDVAALEHELREAFLERADERAIDDYKAAMQQLRRVSVGLPAPVLVQRELRVHIAETVAEEAADDAESEE